MNKPMVERKGDRRTNPRPDLPNANGRQGELRKLCEIPDVADFRIKQLEQQVESLQLQLEQAFYMLELYGVPKVRARTVHNGIGVLASRYSKSEQSFTNQLAEANSLHESLVSGQIELTNRCNELLAALKLARKGIAGTIKHLTDGKVRYEPLSELSADDLAEIDNLIVKVEATL